MAMARDGLVETKSGCGHFNFLSFEKLAGIFHVFVFAQAFLLIKKKSNDRGDRSKKGCLAESFQEIHLQLGKA